MNVTFLERQQELEAKLHVKENFDIVKKTLDVNGYTMCFYFVDGFIKDEVLEKMMEFLLKADIADTIQSHDSMLFSHRFISYVEADISSDLHQMMRAVLSGTILLLVDGLDDGILIDARTYPARETQEPEDDRVLRGSRDGFVETLVYNTALIRRRIRDGRLRMEYHSVGTVSKSDVVLCYMEGIVSSKLLEDVQSRLKNIQVEALTMAQESIAEALVPHRWLNPFPKVRYSERPDSAASNILEGKVILLIDNSPSALILPTTFFDFVQEAQDYYLPPITGTYLRITRIIVFFLALLLTPFWYHLNSNPALVPAWLSFVLIQDNMNLPIIVQFLILEFGIDAMKMASLNTPSALSSSFSIIGALILSDFAVTAGWFAPEVILYMAFVALANFTQTSYELGYAIKFMRIITLLCIAVWPRFGFYIGVLIMLFVLVSSRTVTNTSYLYPLIPFHPKALKTVFIRKKLKGENKRKS